MINISYQFFSLNKWSNILINFNRKEPVFIKDLAVNGVDLIGIGASPGEQTGRLLQKLLDLVITDAAKNERNALLLTAKSFLMKKI